MTLERTNWTRAFAIMVVGISLGLSGLGCGGDATGPSTPAPCGPVGTIKFGSVEIGESVESEWAITNASADTLTGTVTAECDEFSVIEGGGDYSLAANESLTVTVSFAPTSEGSKECTIGTGVACADLMATGTGAAPPAVCVLSLPSGVLEFSSMPVGWTSTRSFTISNAGPPGSRLVGSVRFSVNYGGFRFLSGSGAYDLAPGEIHEVKVQLTHSLGLNSCRIDTGCGDIWAVGSGV